MKRRTESENIWIVSLSKGFCICLLSKGFLFVCFWNCVLFLWWQIEVFWRCLLDLSPLPHYNINIFTFVYKEIHIISSPCMFYFVAFVSLFVMSWVSDAVLKNWVLGSWKCPVVCGGKGTSRNVDSWKRSRNEIAQKGQWPTVRN